jgi:hypothetical protein
VKSKEQSDVDLVVKELLPESIRLSGTSRRELRHGDILLDGEEE